MSIRKYEQTSLATSDQEIRIAYKEKAQYVNSKEQIGFGNLQV